MKFENSPLSKILNYHKLEMPFGNFYLCDNFIISEIHEGVHFSWSKIELTVIELIKHYGSQAKLGFISNRVNSYSVDPQDWKKITDHSDLLIATAIVCYNKRSILSADLEKHFSKLKMETYYSLDEAISWVKSLMITT